MGDWLLFGLAVGTLEGVVGRIGEWCGRIPVVQCTSRQCEGVVRVCQIDKSGGVRCCEPGVD